MRTPSTSTLIESLHHIYDMITLVERGLGVLMFIYCGWKNLGMLSPDGSSVFRMLPPGTLTTSGLRNSAGFRVYVVEDKNG